MVDYYAVLEIHEEADLATIKKSFRVLAKKYHPDLNPDDETAAEKFIEVNEAYNILSDEKARKRYDRSRKKKTEQGAKQQEKTTGEQPNYKYNESESAAVNFENWDEQFESFFGFNPKSNQVDPTKIRKKETQEKTNQAFEDFFGGFHKK